MKRRRAKIDKTTNWRTQLFFGMSDVNFKGMREKEKNSTTAQPYLIREHMPHRRKKDD
jgi:hypothetical protein